MHEQLADRETGLKRGSPWCASWPAVWLMIRRCWYGCVGGGTLGEQKQHHTRACLIVCLSTSARKESAKKTARTSAALRYRGH